MGICNGRIIVHSSRVSIGRRRVREAVRGQALGADFRPLERATAIIREGTRQDKSVVRYSVCDAATRPYAGHNLIAQAAVAEVRVAAPIATAKRRNFVVQVSITQIIWLFYIRTSLPHRVIVRVASSKRRC